MYLTTAVRYIFLFPIATRYLLAVVNVLDSLVVECAYNLFDTFLELCHQPAWGGGSAAYAYVAFPFEPCGIELVDVRY